MSVIDLRKSKDYLELMTQAATYSSGKNAGEFEMKCNPEYKAQVKEAGKRMEIK